MSRAGAALTLLLAWGCSDAPTTSDRPPEVPRGVTLRGVTYCQPGDVSLRMDLYFPSAEAAAKAPAVVFVHGGGWTSGSRTGSPLLAPVRDRLVPLGYVVASIDYRLSPSVRWPAHLQDVKCSIRFLRSRAETYGIDTGRIGAWGASAGGHLAAMLGTTDPGEFEGDGGHAAESSRVTAVLAIAGPMDLTSQDWPPERVQEFGVVFGTTDQGSEIARRASPIHHVSAGDPPFLLIHGTEDAVVPPGQSRRMHEALTAAGVPTELILVANAGHLFAPTGTPFDPPIEVVLDRVVAFFEANVGK